MKVLVTGHDGYIGARIVPMLGEAGHQVVGLDNHLYEGCSFGGDPPAVDEVGGDVRDVTAADLEGIDAVAHLAALSNDPVGDLNPESTYEINHRASVRLAELAKQAGATRFVFSSSCSLYGAADQEVLLDEGAPFNPVTDYGRSKVLAEQEISALAGDDFSPTFLRNATAYGVSTRLRGDLVVNNLVGYALTTGEVRLKSDGSPWRPLVHVEDIGRAFLAALDAPREMVHGRAFNVGRTEENYQIRQIAEMVEDVVQGSVVSFDEGAGPDLRCYRVSFDHLPSVLPGFRPVWTVRRGVEELCEAFERHRLTLEDLTGPRYGRIARVKQLMAEGRLGEDLRWREPLPAARTT